MLVEVSTQIHLKHSITNQQLKTFQLQQLLIQFLYQAENFITLGNEVESTEIDLGTTNKPNVSEMKSNDVIDSRPWYRRYLDF